ncbi:MAG: SnoaL-like domain [Solirubrobacterales bacterium]|jgi:ketosteroid isomerase-like protein|nr:SnoaL-like domain [Solirubrobacterales bacterium]
MSQENENVVRRAAELFNERGIAGAVTAELFAEGVVFYEPPEQPAPRTARGREEMRQMFGGFDAAWADHKTEPQEFRALDDERMLMFSVERFKGRDGITVDAPGAAIITVRDGKIAEWRAFWDRQSAIVAAGLSE